MKKLLLVAICVFALTGIANASLVTFTDVVDPSPNILLTNSSWYGFNHNILDDGFVPSTDTLTSATLDLDLYSAAAGTVKANVKLDGHGLGARDITLMEDLAVQLAWLQSDGQLLVQLKSTGNDPIYFNNSTLTAIADRPGDPAGAPVPEPASMMLLGMGILGLVSFKRKA